MTTQQFAWLPTKVWNMKTRDFYYSYIWFCWYWDSGNRHKGLRLYRLTDDPYEQPLKNHPFVRTTTNRW